MCSFLFLYILKLWQLENVAPPAPPSPILHSSLARVYGKKSPALKYLALLALRASLFKAMFWLSAAIQTVSHCHFHKSSERAFACDHGFHESSMVAQKKEALSDASYPRISPCMFST